MRKRKYMLGSLTLALAVSFAAMAQATVTSQKVEWAPDPSPLPQFAKKPKKGVGLGVRVEADYDNLNPGAPPGGPASSHAEEATIHFDKDFAFSAGTIPVCPESALGSTSTTESAKAACPSSIVGTGDAHLNGALGPLTAVVTAFNGTPNGGLQTIKLQARVGAPLNTTSTLTGTLQPSSKAASGYGKQLHVPVAPLGSGAIVILDFSTSIPKLVAKKGKKTKKGKKPATFYIMASCSDKVWNIEGDFRFVDNPPPIDPSATVENKTLTGTDTAPCKQKKTKKKKKKK